MEIILIEKILFTGLFLLQLLVFGWLIVHGMMLERLEKCLEDMEASFAVRFYKTEDSLRNLRTGIAKGIYSLENLKGGEE